MRSVDCEERRQPDERFGREGMPAFAASPPSSLHPTGEGGTMVEGSTRLPSGTSLTRYFKTILVVDVTLRNVHSQIGRIQSEMAWVRETAREATRQRYSERGW